MATLSVASDSQPRRARICESKSRPVCLAIYSWAARLWSQVLDSAVPEEEDSLTSVYDASFFVQKVQPAQDIA